MVEKKKKTLEAPRSSSDQPCEICGDIGFVEVIVICSKCHKSRQHIYCMDPNFVEVPNTWYCETCWLNNLEPPEAIHSEDPIRCHQQELQDSSRRKRAWNMINGPGKPFASKTTGSWSVTPGRLLSRNVVPKKVETGKVKYLALEEIYAHSNSAKSNKCAQNSFFSPQTGSLGINHVPLSRRKSVEVSNSSKSSHKKVHAPTIGKEPCLKSPSQFSCRSRTSENLTSVVNTITKDKGQTSDAHRPLLNNAPVVCGVQERRNRENTFAGLDNHAGKVNSAMSKNHAHSEKSVVARHSKEDGTSNSTNILKSGEDLPNPPAIQASWKGSFAIHDFPGRHYSGFQAYPPGKISRKAFLVSKQMPSVLQFTLQLRSNVWPETFKEDPPSVLDIALYFLVNDVHRSREYNHLLELLEKKDLSMQSHLDGVDLLVFTSKQLPLEFQRMNKQFFLWGVFVSLKEQKFFDKKGKQLAFNSPLPIYKISEDPVLITHEVDAEEVDMEIDMVGGKEVGTVDTVLITHEVDADEVDMEIDMVGGKEVGTVDIFLRRNSIYACWGNSDIPSQNVLASVNSNSVDTPGLCTSSQLVKVSPSALKVGTQSFSKPIKLEKWDSSSKVTRMVGSKEIVTVDKHCRNSRPGQDNLGASSENVFAVVTSSHKDAPPGFSKSNVLTKMSPDTNKLNTHCLPKPIKLEERDSAAKCDSDMEKSIVVAQQGIGGFEDAADVVCMVCREGYSLRPNDILGIYSYSKLVDLDIGTSTSSRSVRVYSTVSNFNIIHFRCHQEAGQAAVGFMNSKRNGSALSNNEGLHKCIFPLRGPFVQLLSYENRVSKYWDSLNMLHGPADGDRLRLLAYDIVLMLSRFATRTSFNTDSGGRESNARFLPFMIQMAQCLIEQGRSLNYREAMVNRISSYLSCTSTETSYSGPPGFHRQRLTEENVQYMMLNSLFYESYESWLAHRRAFLQHAIYHSYLRNKHALPVLALPSVETCLKPEPVDGSEMFDLSNYLYSTIQPMLVYMGLIEQLQRFLKLSNANNAKGVKIERNAECSLEHWEMIMKAKLVNLKEMLEFSENLLTWLDDMKSAKDLEEAFFVMGTLVDVVADGFSSCEDFVQAAIQSGKK